MQANPQLPTDPPLRGADLVGKTNDALKTLATDFSGDVDPAAYAWPFSKWADTANGLLKRRNAAGSAWDVIGALSLNAGTDHAGDEPAHPVAYMRWADIANNLLKRRSADNTSWITLGPLFDLFFARSNILGTVSQSGGVPTGALIESGSNANGSYMKWADGTMICRGTLAAGGRAMTTSYGSLYINAAPESQDFPAMFVGDLPSVSTHTWAVDGTVPIITLVGTALGSFSFRFTSAVSTTAILGISYTAVGRCF